jgi:redox-sensitive bicupin YhaK (pirin superfamily)
MIKHYPHRELGRHQDGWLDARYHFSFANYHNPERQGFGALRVINDDIIKAGSGFDTHPHKNMEIITYVRNGAITHRDSRGNLGRTEAGDVQVMSAGRGIYHSEFNLESEDTNLFQIWIYPNERDVKPKWSSRTFPKSAHNSTLPLLVSGYAEDQNENVLHIHQKARIYGGVIKAGESINHPITNQAYLLVSEGTVTIDGKIFSKGDGAEITDLEHVLLHANDTAEIVIIDVPTTH